MLDLLLKISRKENEFTLIWNPLKWISCTYSFFHNSLICELSFIFGPFIRPNYVYTQRYHGFKACKLHLKQMQPQLCGIHCLRIHESANATASERTRSRVYTRNKRSDGIDGVDLLMMVVILMVSMYVMNDVTPRQEHLQSFKQQMHIIIIYKYNVHILCIQHTKMLNSNQSIHLNLYGWYVSVPLNCGSSVHALHLQFLYKNWEKFLSSKFVHI